MSDKPIETLLEKLNGGDLTAAEDILRAYEPILRMVIRRQLAPKLRTKLDSVDILQAVWLDLLRGIGRRQWAFHEPKQLRAFLIKLARSRLIDAYRHHQKPIGLEQHLGEFEGEESLPPSVEDRPSEVAQADELWEALLGRIPPNHREVLLLKRSGHSLDEIAGRVGMHKSSVRRIIYESGRRLDESGAAR